MQVEQSPRPSKPATRQREIFLNMADRLFSLGLDLEAIMTSFANLATPELADWCTIDLTRDALKFKRLAFSHCDRDCAAEHAVAGHYPIHFSWITTAVQQRDLLYIADKSQLPPETQNSGDFRAMCHDLGFNSAVIAPLLARGQVVGAITLARIDRGRSFNAEDVALIDTISRRLALVIDNANLLRQAQNAVKARDHFLSLVSHELKTPLTGISVASSLIVKYAVEATEEHINHRIRHGNIVFDAALRMERLLKDLLDAGMIESGNFKIVPKANLVDEIIRDSLKPFEPLITANSIECAVEVGDDCPSVVCDKQRMIQVLTNLLSNALKFTPTGGRISVTARRQGGGTVIVISDSGPGIPPENLRKVFDRYWQDKEAFARGNGLGLYIAKGILEAHKGRISVESEVGRGTTFTAWLPA